MADRVDDATNVKQLLSELETKARKRFGQHFLKDANTVARIVRGARVEPGDTVIEIGPGLGVLTRALIKAEADVTAIELDRDMASYLRDALPALKLVEGDAAKVDWESIAPVGAKVVANLPYNVGTTIVMQLLRSGRFKSITVMLQKEVVDRFMSPSNTRAYGALTVEAGVWASPVFVCAVAPGSFHPPPKVRSSVVRFDVHPDGPRCGGVEPRAFDRMVRAAFSKRRKTLLNSMSDGFERASIAAAIETLGWDPKIRGEALSPRDFRDLAGVLVGRKDADSSPTG